MKYICKVKLLVVNMIFQKRSLNFSLVSLHRNYLSKGIFWFIELAFLSHWRPTALLIQASITFPVWQTVTLISDLNIKPQSTSFFTAKATWYDSLFGLPATCETPRLNGVYRTAILLFALEQTWPFIQVHFVSLEKASTMTQHSLNSRSSDMWRVGARKVQVAVRRQTIW